jgi:hypothetical protein
MMNHNKNGNVQLALLFSLVLGILAAVLILFLVSCKSSQKALSSILQDSTITVYPAIVRTQDGITYDLDNTKSIQSALQKITTVDVTISSEEINMEGTAAENAFQYGIFQASLKRFGDYIKDQSISTNYAVVSDFLITKTPDGGYAAGGIHCYLVNQNGEKEYALLLNSHHELFNEGDLKSDDLQQVIDGCKQVLLKAVELDA